MKRLALLLVLGCLLLPLAATPAQAASSGWVCAIVPGFAFHGEEVSISVSGEPNRFAVINITCLNSTYSVERSMHLNENGSGQMFFVVGWEGVPAGMYNVTVLRSGEVMATAQFEVIYSATAWNTHENQLDNERDAKQAVDIARLKADLAKTNQQIAEMWYYVMAAFACGVIATVFVAKKMAPLIKYEMKRDSDEESLFRKFRRFVSTFTYPDPEGLKVKVMPTLKEEAKRLTEQLDDKYTEPVAVLKVNGEMRTYPLNVDGEILNIIDNSPAVEARLLENEKMLAELRMKLADLQKPPEPKQDTPKVEEAPPAPTIVQDTPKAVPPMPPKQKEPDAPVTPSAPKPAPVQKVAQKPRKRRSNAKAAEMSAEEMETHGSALEAAPVIDPVAGKITRRRPKDEGVPL